MSPQRSLLLLTPTARARGGLQSSPLISVDLRLWLRDHQRRYGDVRRDRSRYLCSSSVTNTGRVLRGFGLIRSFTDANRI